MAGWRSRLPWLHYPILLCCLLGCTPSPPAEPEVTRVARVGDCYGDASAAPVACASRHIAQTVFVSDAPPPADEAAARVPCREAQSRFLGQDFNTRLSVELWLANDRSWYRCDVLLRNSTQASQGYQSLTGSLEGVLDKRVPTDLRACLNAAYDPDADQPYVTCREPHVSRELTVAPAIGTVDESFPDDVAQRATSACNATAAAEEHLRPDRIVTAFYPKDADAWASGVRTADCWVTATNGTLPAIPSKPR
jgi:hypothetical protein